MKVWMVATYKKNELKRLQNNLQNQNFKFYYPKIKTIKNNMSIVEEPLFHGYIFISARIEDYQKIKYTKGISNVISFNNNIATLANDEITELKRIEETSSLEPIVQKVFVGQEGAMIDGPFKGSLIKIASLPKKDRVNVFVHILGTNRRITTSLSKIQL